MKKLAFLSILLCLMSFGVRAQDDVPHRDIMIKVNGMVCDFCAQSVWKVFEKYDAVEYIDVDLDIGLVTVHLKSGQGLSDDDLDKSITYAGYDLVSIERVDHATAL